MLLLLLISCATLRTDREIRLTLEFLSCSEDPKSRVFSLVFPGKYFDMLNFSVFTLGFDCVIDSAVGLLRIRGLGLLGGERILGFSCVLLDGVV